jgi:transposase
MKRPTSVTKINNHIQPATLKKARISRADRLYRVQILMIGGKSNREIARVLGVDEGTIRRDRRTLALSKTEVQAIQAGAHAEPLLQKQKKSAIEDLRRQQAAEEKRFGKISKRLSRAISDWVSQFKLCGPNKLWILQQAEKRSWHCHVMSDSLFTISNAAAVIAQTRPGKDIPEYAPELMEWLLRWLMDWILKIEPNRQIRERAFRNLLQEVQREVPAW